MSADCGHQRICLPGSPAAWELGVACSSTCLDPDTAPQDWMAFSVYIMTHCEAFSYFCYKTGSSHSLGGLGLMHVTLGPSHGPPLPDF